jgi:hypothetical protein
MARWEDIVLIDRPIDEVFAYITDFFNAPRVSGSGIVGLRQTSPGPLGVGSMAQGRRVVLGFETRNTFHVTEWNPPRTFAVTTEGRPFRSMDTRLTLEPVGNGTKLHELVNFELQLPLKLLWPVMGPVVRRRLHASFARTKAAIEATPPSRAPGS